MNGSGDAIISFGPFRLSPATRALEKNGVPLTLGHRALDILIVLAERPGQIVSHRELISRVWRGLVVSPGNLRVHMTGLRKALGDGVGGDRYIANVVGQGYSFVAPINREAGPKPARMPEYPCGAARRRLVLPPVLTRMVGRDEAVRTITNDIIADRFVTIVGPGGMGKTTVAVSVAHALLEEFGDAVCFVDIATVTDSKLVAATIASTLGLTVQSEDVLPTLMQCLRTLRILLVLDNCEHVIDAVATLAEQIFAEAPAVHILATSREALRVEGEHAYWLPPLASPSPDADVKAAEALTFPAVRLFMERAAASGGRFELTDANAPAVINICARLDGIALAIELAAGRVGTHGVAATADLVNKRFGLHWKGRRTAPHRHQTLHALLDWSYCTLAESQRRVFTRLSVFVGSFTAEAAQAVATDGTPEASYISDDLDALVTKSLVSSIISDDGMPRYRLLETTRVYALEKLDETHDRHVISRRHAQYFASLLGGCDEINNPPRAIRPASLSEHLGNVRASLEWCFSDNEITSAGSDIRDPVLAIDLASACVAVFLDLSLLSECYRWSTAALELLDDRTRGSKRELVLQEARAISSTWTLGNGDLVRAAITRALRIADNLPETSYRLRLMVGLHVFLQRTGDFRGSLGIAQQLHAEAFRGEDAAYEILSDWMRGSSEHFIGNQKAARDHFEKGFARMGPRNLQVFGLDYRVRALVTFARVLWLNGSPDRAMQIAAEAIAEAAKLSKPLNVCFSLLYTAPVFLWCGDLGAAREVLEKLMAHPNYHALPSFHVSALALHGELLIRSAEAERGVTSLRSALITMRADRQNLLLAHVTCAFAEGLISIGQHEEALAAISKTLLEADEGAEIAELPELLRMRAEVLLSKPEADESEAEKYLEEALTVARRQSALSWELRIATSFARVRTRQGRADEARQLLGAVYSRFTEGFGTGDLKSARQVLTELDEAPRPLPPPARPDQHDLSRPRSNHADADGAGRRFT